MSSLLAIDYGTKRCGLARSDSNRILATGLPTFEKRPGRSFHRHLRSLAESGEYACVVLGLPVNDNDDDFDHDDDHDNHDNAANAAPSAGLDAAVNAPPGSLSAEIQSLGGWIERELGLSVVYWDETLTSVEAESRLRMARRGQRRDKGAIDRLAAEILLQEFLDAGSPGAPDLAGDRS